MATVKFGTFSKRRNSTKVPTTELSDSRTVTLKEATSQDRPIFKVSGNNFNYNYCEWDGKYYFIDEIESLINNEVAIHCIMDPLATYKSYITGSTQFVSYSADGTRTAPAWLEDTRIPVLKSATVDKVSGSISLLDNTLQGAYILSVVGKESAVTYICTLANVKDVIAAISTWETQEMSTAKAQIQVHTTGGSTDFGDAIDTLNQTIATIGNSMVNTGFIGNAYAEAPSCIRSCIWVPFTNPISEGWGDIWLGNFDTGVRAKIASTKPNKQLAALSLSIPWQHSDWRRATCEEVYLYLPMVGMVNIPSTEIVNETTINIDPSATATDGVICYEVTAGNQKLGIYSGSCAANYPIGISQQASAGEVFQQLLGGAEKIISTGVQASTSFNPMAWVAGGAAIGMEAFDTTYNTLNARNSRHNTCIGSAGGGAGAGLSLDAYCFTVSHDTVISPTQTDYVATMGVPIMKAIPLSQCSGYTQCANAHIEAPATAGELNAIDAMVNGGFYIE